MTAPAPTHAEAVRDLYRMFMDAGFLPHRIDRMEVWQAAHYCTTERPPSIAPGTRRDAVTPMDPRQNPAHGGAIAAALEASRRARAGVG